MPYGRAAQLFQEQWYVQALSLFFLNHGDLALRLFARGDSEGTGLRRAGRGAGEAGQGRQSRANAGPLRFGWLGSYGYFNGGVRDVSVYKRALSHAEIFAQYRAGK
jgi:hypothetical protein